jgi:uronate dehydrogenase
MKVLVTGAAGVVGPHVARELAASGHDLRLLDLKPMQDLPGQHVQGDISEWDTVRRAVEGMDAVVNLAAYIPRGAPRDFPPHLHWENDIRVDVLGTDFLLHAALQEGVKRFVHVSTNSVFDKIYPAEGEQLAEDAQPLPVGHYGMCKFLAEELCRLFAHAHGLSCVVLRLNTVTTSEEWARVKGQDPHHMTAMRVHASDVARAVRLALEKEQVRWGIFRVSGDNPDRRWPMDYTRQVLGFEPEYGFEVGRMLRHGTPCDEC